VALDPAADVLERALDIARKAVPEGEVSIRVRGGRDANTRFAQGAVLSNGDVEETTTQVHVALGQRHAAAEANQTDAQSLRATVDQAVSMARLAPLDPESMSLLPAQRYPTVAGAYDEPTARLSEGQRGEAASAIFTAARERDLRAAGYYEHSAWEVALGNSAGLRARHAQTQASLDATLRTPDGAGSGWAMAASHRVGEIDASAVALVAGGKAQRSREPHPADPGRYTVILEPAAVAELLDFLADYLDARRADEGRSFFARPGGGNRLGEKIFSDLVTIRSDPTDKDTPGAPFDDEGVPLPPRTWIEKGTLAALRYSRFWAKKQGKESTGAPDVYALAPGTAASVEELLHRTKRGLLVTRFWYTRVVDPQSMLITGLTRDGVFLIEDGRITAPVNNFRFNESPVTVLRNVDALTRTTVNVPPWRVPALRTHEFLMASKSQAV